MSVTTPEILEPNELLAYDVRSFTEIVPGGGPDGTLDCLRINHAVDSNKQSMFQPLRTASMLWPAAPETNALSFWIRRRQAFAGTGSQLPNSFTSPSSTSSGALPAAGGVIFGMGNAIETSMVASSQPLSWGVMGYNTDDLGLYLNYRAGGSASWWGPKLADLTLDEWTFVVINLGAINGGAGSNTPAPGGLTTYVNGLVRSSGSSFNFPASSSSGGFYLRPQNFDTTLVRFAIGDPTAANAAIRGVGDGPLVELSQIAFHTRELTAFEILTLYESMLYGG